MNIKLRDTVEAYRTELQQGEREELEFFEHLSSLKKVIDKAGLAEDRNCKRYSHQYRLKKLALEKGRDALLQVKASIENARNFDELHRVVENAVQSIHGIGELYTYDTALRISAHLKCLPGKVYLHAGTRVGARALNITGKGPLRMENLPPELKGLEPHEVENVLCLYANHLRHAYSGNGNCSSRRNGGCVPKATRRKIC